MHGLKAGPCGLSAPPGPLGPELPLSPCWGKPEGENASSERCSGGAGTAPSSPKEEREKGHRPTSSQPEWAGACHEDNMGQQNTPAIHAHPPYPQTSPPDPTFLHPTKKKAKYSRPRKKNKPPNPKHDPPIAYLEPTLWNWIAL